MERKNPVRAAALVIFFLLFAFSSSITSCSVQKRHYRKGFYVQARHRPAPVEVLKSPVEKRRVVKKATRDLISDAENNQVQTQLVCVAGLKKNLDVPVTRITTVFTPSVTSPASHNSVVIAHTELRSGGEGRKIEWMGLVAFLVGVGAWLALVLYPITLLQVGLFVISAGLAALSMTKMSRAPDRYVLRTLSFVALLLSLIGLAVLLYAGLIYLLS